MPSLLVTNKDSGVALADFIIIDNITNFPVGCYLHNPQGGHFSSFPHKCQRQSGVVSVTAASGTPYTIPPVQTFRYPYPRPPVSLVSTGNSIGQGYNGNRIMHSEFYRVLNTSVQPFLESGDGVNWSATTTTLMNWSAALDEI